MIRVQLHLTKYQLKALQKISKAEETSVAALVRQAVKEMLESKKVKCTVSEFTKQELTVLFEAVGLWESVCGCESPSPEKIFAGVTTGEQALERIAQAAHEHHEKHVADLKSRAERGCVLRAKILKMRDGVVAGEFVDGSK